MATIDLTATVQQMLAAQFSYIQRYTGTSAPSAPPLVTSLGLVKNNQAEADGALNGYLPPDVSTSEGQSLLMRGMLRSYLATGNQDFLTYAKSLADALFEYFYFGVRPPSEPTEWNHHWLVNAGTPFPVLGPVSPDGPAYSGYIAKEVTFTSGVAQVEPTLYRVYKAFSDDGALLWENVFSDLTAGTEYAIDYYIDAARNKVQGVQGNGSFGATSTPNSTEPPGRIVLQNKTLGGAARLNYAVSTSTLIPTGTQFEGWPMWRELVKNPGGTIIERDTATDAIHWIIDCFKLLMEAEPSVQEWQDGYHRMLETWERACYIPASTTYAFKKLPGTLYNQFPLTYFYAYGTNADGANLTYVDPTDYLSYGRDASGYAEFVLPDDQYRYSFNFENAPMYITYDADSSVSVEISTSATVLPSLSIDSPEA